MDQGLSERLGDRLHRHQVALYLGAILAVNFVCLPPAAWGLSRFVADDRGLTIGVRRVPLTPASTT